MLPQLAVVFNRLERRKAALIARGSRLTPHQQRFSPAAGSWSPLETLDHLVLTEAAILEAMIRSISQRHPVTTADRLRGRLITLLFLTPVRVKVPPRAAHILPRGESTLDAHAAAWQFLRRRMSETLDTVPPEALRTGAFLHPVSGRMDLPQTLRFLSAHIVHHGYQLTRSTRRSLGYKPPPQAGGSSDHHPRAA